ncbi:MAG TPA: DUF2149 domain-containing protein [Sulfurimonas sp.]|uniref:DUF2149 domain-containing protein n=1 Tax=Sulfurimonas sp. TaxID=2022749 RepID=UPI002BC28409|nr:DUF2149 domain-containing protein [Sulfurimonas sp.]HUH42641.1 DUF2149 domain-containing protein [Sulfurimonas sp.]
MAVRFLEDDDDNNPMHSVINLIDIFLVVIAALLIIIFQNPLNPFSSDDVTVIKNAGKKDMQIMVKKGQEIKKYESKGNIGEGNGVKAGVSYRMEDGSFVYIPDEEAKK